MAYPSASGPSQSAFLSGGDLVGFDVASIVSAVVQLSKHFLRLGHGGRCQIGFTIEAGLGAPLRDGQNALALDAAEANAGDGRRREKIGLPPPPVAGGFSRASDLPAATEMARGPPAAGSSLRRDGLLRSAPRIYPPPLLLASNAFAVDAASRRSTVSDDNGNFAGYPCLTNSLPLRQIGFTNNAARRMATTRKAQFY